MLQKTCTKTLQRLEGAASVDGDLIAKKTLEECHINDDLRVIHDEDEEIKSRTPQPECDIYVM